jgi:hypothetical protein
MSQKTQKVLNDEELYATAIEFESRKFTNEELIEIAQSRRSTPRPVQTEGRQSAGAGA